VRIRLARPADVEAIEVLVERAYEPYVALIGGRPAPMDDDYAQKVGRGLVSVADDTEPIGVIVLLDNPGHTLIENVAVDPDRQHEGVGRTLLSFAESHAREAGLGELRLYTNAAMADNLALYARLGYEETDRRTDKGFERVFLAKSLRL
jgi:ribosomal protein S18 acetylase RimI-like enzyme